MRKKSVLFKKIYFILIMMMLFTTAIAGMQAMAVTNSTSASDQQNKVNWKSNAKDGEIQVPEGVTGDGGKWESPTYTPSDEDTKSTETIKKQ